MRTLKIALCCSERGVKARMLECQMHVGGKKDFPENDLNAIEQIANEQIQSCKKHPMPCPPDNAPDSAFVHWIAFFAMNRAEVSLLCQRVMVVLMFILV